MVFFFRVWSKLIDLGALVVHWMKGTDAKEPCPLLCRVASWTLICIVEVAISPLQYGLLQFLGKNNFLWCTSTRSVNKKDRYIIFKKEKKHPHCKVSIKLLTKPSGTVERNWCCKGNRVMTYHFISARKMWPCSEQQKLLPWWGRGLVVQLGKWNTIWLEILSNPSRLSILCPRRIPLFIWATTARL